MKIAYLILAHNNELHLKRLVSAIKTKCSDIYVHIDRKYKNNFEYISKMNYVYSNYSVEWGDFSVCEATLHLLQEAHNRGFYDYYFLISGADYPIKNNDYIRKYLRQSMGKEFIGIKMMPTSDKPLYRFEKYHIPGMYRHIFGSMLINNLNTIIRKLPYKRKFPVEISSLQPYAGTAWWCLSGGCIDYIMTRLKKHPILFEYYKNTSVPDEMFFHTIVGNSKFMSNVTNTLTYTDWSMGGAHPMNIDYRHLPMIREQNKLKPTENKRRVYLFARKFNDQSGKIVKAIDKIIKSSSQ